MNKEYRKLVLASGSPRRRQLFEQLQIEFTLDPSNYEEDMTLKMKPTALAKFLSDGKASETATRHPDAYVVGADTFVVLGKKLLGKPKSPEQAIQDLKDIRGRVVKIITGYTIIRTSDQKKISKSVTSKVYFRKDFTDSEIKKYVGSGEPLDKAGSFAIQDFSGQFIKKITGDFYSIIGLPIYAVLEDLRKLGWKDK